MYIEPLFLDLLVQSCIFHAWLMTTRGQTAPQYLFLKQSHTPTLLEQEGPIPTGP